MFSLSNDTIGAIFIIYAFAFFTTFANDGVYLDFGLYYLRTNFIPNTVKKWIFVNSCLNKIFFPSLIKKMVAIS